MMTSFMICTLHQISLKSRRMRYVGHVTRIVLMGKREGKRPFGRPRRRWEDNIKVDLKEIIGRHGMDRFGSGQGQLHCLGCQSDRTGFFIRLFHQRNFFTV
jgi:hypothetical protein